MYTPAKLYVRIRGLTPLLQHNAVHGMDPERGPKVKRIPTPEEEAERGTYRLPNGQLCVPLGALRSCLISGGIGYRVRNRALTTILKGAIIGLESIDGDPEWGPLVTHTDEAIHDYTIDIRPAFLKIRGGKVMVLRARPRINEWECEFHILYDQDFVGPDLIIETLSRAGIMVGILDFRPEKSGTFGRFEVITWHVVDTEDEQGPSGIATKSPA